MNKKPITEISSEELLKTIEDNHDIKEQTSYSYKNDILDFISTFNLKNGSDEITNKLLHKIYSSWSKIKLNQSEFTHQIHLFFNSKKAGGKYFILLNLDYNALLKKSLFSIAKKSKTKRKSYKVHFEKYLNKYSITNGSFFIKDSVLYNLYDKWTYSFKKSHPLGPIQFNGFCKLYFKFKYIEGGYWFGVDKSIIQHLSEDNINQMRKSNNVKKSNKA